MKRSSFAVLWDIQYDKRICLYTTGVTLREIRMKIEDDIGREAAFMRKAAKSARILRDIGTAVQDSLSGEALSKSVHNRYDECRSLLSAAGVREIPLADHGVNRVFDRYFEGRAPFDEGKKKHEFADAFVLDALSQWCEHHNESMYVISTDADMSDYCAEDNQLHHLAALEEFLDLVSRQDAALASDLAAALDTNRDTIERQVEDAFRECLLYLESRTVIADIRLVEVLSVSCGYDAKILHITPETAQVSLEALISFSVELDSSGLDGSSDDEANRLPEMLVDIEDQRIDVSLFLTYPRDDPHQLRVSDVSLNSGAEIPVRIA